MVGAGVLAAVVVIAVIEFRIAPDFSGFNHPAVNDDLAVLTLAEDVPDGGPDLFAADLGDLEAGTVLTLVGYGRAGDGLHGYTASATPSVKRVGENTADAFYGQDDKGPPDANEVFRFDFDGPSGNGPLGGPTLGNDKETPRWAAATPGAQPSRSATAAS